MFSGSETTTYSEPVNSVTETKGHDSGTADAVMKEVKEMFRLLDVKGNGTIDKQEIESIYKTMGVTLTDADCDVIIQEMGGEGEEARDGLGFHDFVAGMYKDVEVRFYCLLD